MRNNFSELFVWARIRQWKTNVPPGFRLGCLILYPSIFLLLSSFREDSWRRMVTYSHLSQRFRKLGTEMNHSGHCRIPEQKNHSFRESIHCCHLYMPEENALCSFFFLSPPLYPFSWIKLTPSFFWVSSNIEDTYFLQLYFTFIIFFSSLVERYLLFFLSEAWLRFHFRKCVDVSRVSSGLNVLSLSGR